MRKKFIWRWSSVKCKRVARSVLAAELYALTRGFYAGFALRHTVGKIIGRNITVRVITDSCTVYDSVMSLCSMTEKGLLIDIYFLREAHLSGDLGKLGWIWIQLVIADILTKDMKRRAVYSVLCIHRIHTPVGQCTTHGQIPTRKFFELQLPNPLHAVDFPFFLCWLYIIYDTISSP